MILPNTGGGNVTPSTDSDVKNFLKTIELPGIGRTLGDVGRVLEVIEADARIVARIELGFPAVGAHAAYRSTIVAAAAAESGCDDIDVEFSTRIVAADIRRAGSRASHWFGKRHSRAKGARGRHPCTRCQ